MSLSLYIGLVLVLFALDATVLTYSYSAWLSSSLVPAFILLRAILDAAFLLANYKRIRLTKLEMLIFTVPLAYGMIGVTILPQMDPVYSAYRALNDTLWPIGFVMKVAVIRHLLFKNDLMENDLRRVNLWLAVFSMVQIAIFLYYSGQTGAYAGITPPATLPLAWGICTNQWFLTVAMLSLIIVSGKRSFLVAALFALAISIICAKGRRMRVLGASLVLLVFAMPIAFMFGDAIGEKMASSFAIFGQWSSFQDAGTDIFFIQEVRTGFYMATAGRSEEFYGVLSAMSPHNFLIGLGAGFTYSFQHIDGPMDGYANAHFSPLALTYKFGLPYCFILYWYIFRNTYSAMRTATQSDRLVGFSLFMLAIQSIFAFNLFAEMLFPLLVAMNQKRVLREAPTRERHAVVEHTSGEVVG